MLFIDQEEYLHQQALQELRVRFKKVRASTQAGKEFWAEPNFQQTTFNGGLLSGGNDCERIDLEDGYFIVCRKHRPFWRTREYIVTYEIKKS